MRYVSLFSGIEAASVAFRSLGWEPLAFSEIAPFPSRVLAHHYPDVPNVGDITKHDWSQYRGKCDLVVGGPPCQAFSVAGLRRSLDDDRGNLSLEYVRAIHAIDPLWSITENVPGWLSTGDNAFGCFLGALAGDDAPLVPVGGRWTDAGVAHGPRRSVAWRILDAQYFGLAQRRRRVFVLSVRGAGDWRSAAALFPLSASLRGDPPPRRAAGQGTPGRAANGAGEGDDVGLIAFDTTQITSGENRCRPAPGDPAHPLAAGAHPPAIAFSAKDHGADAGDLAPTLRAGGHTTSHANGGVMPAIAFRSTHSNGGVAEDGTMLTLSCSEPAAIAFHVTQDPISGDVTPAMSAGNRQGCATLGVARFTSATEFLPQSSRVYSAEGDLAPTLQATGKRLGNRAPQVQHSMSVRRLTPRECERLMGLPDDYTAIPGAADGPRYRALGNSMAVPVVRWLGRRIEFVERISIAAQEAA